MSAIVGGSVLPLWPGGNPPGVNAFSIAASNSAVYYVFQVQEPVTIRRLGFMQASITGSPGSYKVSLQGVDGSGNPDGTIKGGGSPASMSYTPGAGANLWMWKTLDNAYAAARGERLALVIAPDTGTFDASNFLRITHINGLSPAFGLPYGITNTAGTLARVTNSPMFAFGDTASTFGRPSTTTVGTVSFNSGSTPDEYAVKFTLPASFGSTFKVCGAVVWGTTTAGSTFDLLLYDSDGTTVLQQTTFDTDLDVTPTSNQARTFYFDDAPAVLSAGTAYRLGVQPAGSNISLDRLQVPAAADMDAYRLGQAILMSTRTNAGAWTDDATQRVGIDLILSDLTPPAGGGGGGARYQGMSIGL
jgi:hypothetical protein